MCPLSSSLHSLPFLSPSFLLADHLPQTFSGLWPLASFSTLAVPSLLPALAHFHEADHLKDIPIQYTSSSLPSSSSSFPPKEGGNEGGQQQPPMPLPLVERVRRLVEKETGKRPKGKICLLTHLRYLGYTFNPVSFYYVWDEEVGKEGGKERGREEESDLNIGRHSHPSLPLSLPPGPAS